MYNEQIRKVLEERMSTDDKYTNLVKKCWKKEIKVLSSDVGEMINFLKNDCTGDEFSLISEIFVEIIKNTKSMKLLKTYKEISKKYPDETDEFQIYKCINKAEKKLVHLLKKQ